MAAMAMRSMMLTLLPCVNSLDSSQSRSVEDKFIADMRAAPRGTVGYVLDVGANTGTWSWQWRGLCGEMGAEGKVVEVHTFEPQSIFLGRLTNQTAKLNAVRGCAAFFYAAAADRHDGFVRVTTNRVGSQTASMTPVDASHAGESSVMPALDLGKFLTTRVPRAHGISLMKLDVEGGEFRLLPWLLLHGAICHLRYLHLEWHLNRLAVEERLSGLALRLTLHSLLEEGCDVAPAAIFHGVLAMCWPRSLDPIYRPHDLSCDAQTMKSPTYLVPLATTTSFRANTIETHGSQTPRHRTTSDSQFPDSSSWRRSMAFGPIRIVGRSLH